MTVFIAPLAIAQRAEVAPLVAILSAPEAHTDRLISTMGVLHQGGMITLCLDRESVDYDVAFNCVAIQNDDSLKNAMQDSLPALSGAYVQVIGTFDAREPKPKRYVGVIRNVTVVRRLTPRLND